MKYTCIEEKKKSVSLMPISLAQKIAVQRSFDFGKPQNGSKSKYVYWTVRLLGHSYYPQDYWGRWGWGRQGVVPWNIFFLPGTYIYELSALEHTPSSFEKGNHRSFPKGIFLDPRKFLMLECCQEQPVAVVLYEWIFFKRFLFNRCLILISMVYIYSDK